MIGDPFQSASLEGLPPIAVPMTVKMPDPMTAPIPSAVSETGPSVFFSECSGLSESEISLSIDLVAKIWRARVEPRRGNLWGCHDCKGKGSQTPHEGTQRAMCHMSWPIASETPSGRLLAVAAHVVPLMVRTIRLLIPG